jgi:hypothetical protein
MAGRGTSDPAENLEQGRLPGAITPDDPDDFSLSNIERDISERPEVFVGSYAGLVAAPHE